MFDFIADFIAGITEFFARPWTEKMNKKWKKRK